MKRKLIILVIVLLFTSGCWSSRELNELGIASAVGIDKSDDGYLVTVQIINPGEIAGASRTTRSPVSSYTTTGKTVFEAIRKLTVKTPRRVYLSHARIIVFGEEMAQEGIKKALDFLSRDHELRTDFFIVIAKDEKAVNVLKIFTPIENIPANKMFSSLEMSEKVWAPTKAVHLDDLVTNITSKGINPVLTGIEILGESSEGTDIRNIEKINSPTTLKYVGLGGFKGDKLVGWLNEAESKGYNELTDNVNSSVLTVPCEDGKLAIEVVQSKTKLKGKVENGKPKINVEVRVEGNVGEVMCGIDLTKTENIEKLQQTTEKEIKDLMEKAIKKAQEDLGSDIFGFGEVIHRADPKAWKELKKNWDEQFVNLAVDIKATVEIRRLGTITESFQKEKEE